MKKTHYRFRLTSYVKAPRLKSLLLGSASSVGGLMLCLSSTATSANPNMNYILRIEMAPAVCEIDPTQRKARKCLEGYSFIIKGLYPEIIAQNCQTSSSANLSPLHARAIARVMPNEQAREQLWKSVGNCVQGNASQYFRQIMTYAERLKIPSSLTTEKSFYAYHQGIRQQIQAINPQLPADGFRLMCQTNPRTRQVVLTELHICYGTNGLYRQCSPQVVSNCPTSFVIEGSY